MFERFTGPARRVVVLAQEEARMLDHSYIGTEHILLGLVHEDEGLAAQALRALGVRLQDARDQVVVLTGRGPAAPSGHIPFTPRAKNVLEASLREALQYGDNHIGTEHLLLGLLREGEGVATRALVAMGVDLGEVRQQVNQLRHGPSGLRAGPRDVRYARTPGPSEFAGRTRRFGEIRTAIESIMLRLTAIEAALGIERVPRPAHLLAYDLRLASLREERDAAIDAQEFAEAARVRDREKQLEQELAAEESRWHGEAAPGSPGAEGGSGGVTVAELRRLRLLVEQLHALLRDRDTDPPASGTPPAEAPEGPAGPPTGTG